MTTRAMVLPTILLFAVSAAAQDPTVIDLKSSGAEDETRFGPATFCDGADSSQASHSAIELRVVSMEPASAHVGDLISFSIELRNQSEKEIEIPVEPCSKDKGVFAQPALNEYINACINLNYTSAGRDDCFTSSCLCGSSKRLGTTKVLKPRDAVVFHDKAKLLLGDPSLYMALLKEPVIMQVTSAWSQSRVQITDRSKPIGLSGCEIPTLESSETGSGFRLELIPPAANKEAERNEDKEQW